MEKKLERNQQNKMIAGVASGLADYTGMDLTLIRVIFIVFAVFGIAEFVYIIMWIAVPEKSMFSNYAAFNADYQVKEEPFVAQPFYPAPKPKSNSGRIIAGVILIGLGIWFMLAELDIIPDWFSIFKLWPLILIILGLTILFSKRKKPIEFKAQEPIINKTDDQTTA